MSRLAVVTGGAQGIGRACVRRLLSEGWRVASLDIDAEAVSELAAARDEAALLSLEADVSDEGSVAGAFERLFDWSGDAEPRLDLLLNNAAIADPVAGPLEELSLSEWRRRVDSSLTAAFLCSREAIPALRRGRGTIVNMASTRAFQSEPQCEPYAAAKGGLVALTHALAVSLGPEIRVNAIAPGWIEVRDRAKASERETPEHSEADRAQHPVGRVGRPEDVAEALLWLLGAGFVTGQTVVIDGGMSRRMIYAE